MGEDLRSDSAGSSTLPTMRPLSMTSPPRPSGTERRAMGVELGWQARFRQASLGLRLGRASARRTRSAGSSSTLLPGSSTRSA